MNLHDDLKTGRAESVFTSSIDSTRNDLTNTEVRGETFYIYLRGNKPKDVRFYHKNIEMKMDVQGASINVEDHLRLSMGKKIGKFAVTIQLSMCSDEDDS